MPNDAFKLRWDLMIMMLSLFNCFFVPIEVAFDPKSLKNNSYEAMNYVIDFIFLLDIIVCFRTIYIDKQGQEERDPWEIAKIYI